MPDLISSAGTVRGETIEWRYSDDFVIEGNSFYAVIAAKSIHLMEGHRPGALSGFVFMLLFLFKRIFI